MLFLYSVLATLLGVAALPILFLLGFRHRALRSSLPERYGGVVPTGEGEPDPIWIHGVSVGEVRVAQRLLGELLASRPEGGFALSTSTLAGRRLALEGENEEYRSFFVPIDAPFAIRRTLKRLRPSALVLMETEIWPNLILACSRAEIPVFLANGRISERSFPRYRQVRFLLRRVLPHVSLFCMRSKEDSSRICNLGAPPERIKVTGDLKWDLASPSESPESVRADLGVPAGAPVLVAGSTGEGEEERMVRAWEQARKTNPELRLILAPRHPARFEKVSDTLSRLGVLFTRRSRQGRMEHSPLLLLDTVGELARIYGAGTMSFVGGSFTSRGGQNLLEPLAWGQPVLFGPHTENFSDIAQSLLETGAGFRVRNEIELASTVGRLLADPRISEKAAQSGLHLLATNRGATRKTAEAIDRLLADSGA